METVFVLLVAGAINVLCFMIGAKVGQAASKGEEITLPNPIEAAKEHSERKEAHRAAEEEKNRIETIMRNIDNYDGTGYGQEEV